MPILAEPSSQTRSLVSRAILLYIIVLVGLSASAWSIALFRGHVLHEPFPRNSLLYVREVQFTDWTDCTRRIEHFGESNLLGRTDVGAGYGYPAPTVYLFLIFIRLFHNSLRAYLVAASATFMVSTLLFSAHVRRLARDRLPQIAIWLTLVLGFPALFLMDRGNIEVFLWLFVLLGIVAFVRDSQYTAALLFALAGSMKIYPLIFLLLFIPRRQYKALALGAFAVCAFSGLAIVGIGPNIRETLHAISHNASLVRVAYFFHLSPGEIRFDHSIFSDVRQLINLYLHARYNIGPSNYPTFEASTRIYSIVTPLAFVILYVVRLRRLPLLNQFMGLTICSIVLPYISGEYTLVHVYLIWAAFLSFLLTDVKAGFSDLSSKRMNLMMSSFAVVIAPLSFLVLKTHSGFSGQIKSLVLVFLLAVILRTPMPSSLFGDLAPATPKSSSAALGPRDCHSERIDVQDLFAGRRPGTTITGGTMKLISVVSPSYNEEGNVETPVLRVSRSVL
jgi:Glycosyltransferase family 87